MLSCCSQRKMYNLRQTICNLSAGVLTVLLGDCPTLYAFLRIFAFNITNGCSGRALPQSPFFHGGRLRLSHWLNSLSHPNCTDMAGRLCVQGCL